jgi:hypothetical protein
MVSFREIGIWVHKYLKMYSQGFAGDVGLCITSGQIAFIVRQMISCVFSFKAGLTAAIILSDLIFPIMRT